MFIAYLFFQIFLQQIFFLLHRLTKQSRGEQVLSFEKLKYIFDVESIFSNSISRCFEN